MVPGMSSGWARRSQGRRDNEKAGMAAELGDRRQAALYLNDCWGPAETNHRDTFAHYMAIQRPIKQLPCWVVYIFTKCITYNMK